MRHPDDRPPTAGEWNGGHPDEGTIHAWLDDALPEDEAVAVERHVAECSACAAAVAEARGLIAASSRILRALDVVPGDVLPASAPASADATPPIQPDPPPAADDAGVTPLADAGRRRGRVTVRRAWQGWPARAAALALVAAGSWVVVQRERLAPTDLATESAPPSAPMVDPSPAPPAPSAPPAPQRDVAPTGGAAAGTAPSEPGSPADRRARAAGVSGFAPASPATPGSAAAGAGSPSAAAAARERAAGTAAQRAPDLARAPGVADAAPPTVMKTAPADVGSNPATVAPVPVPPSPPAPMPADPSAQRAVRLRAPVSISGRVAGAAARASDSTGRVVTGRVLSTTGIPLQGANVYLPSGAASVGTDPDGRFRLIAPPGSDTLLVRSVGFRPERVALPRTAGDSAEPLTVRLQADQTRLSELVVTGVSAPAPAESLTQAEAGHPVPPAAGCYRVELDWAAMAARDAAARVDRTLPELVRLTGEPAGQGWWRADSLRGAEGDTPAARVNGVAPRWRADGDRAVELEWPRAGGALRLRLRVAGERLTGVADLRQDGSAVPVTLRRTRCEVR